VPLAVLLQRTFLITFELPISYSIIINVNAWKMFKKEIQQQAETGCSFYDKAKSAGRSKIALQEQD
jgi:hypothetical protein